MRTLLVAAVASLALGSLAACHSKASACGGVTGACVGFEQGASESAIATGFAQAAQGSTLAFGEGTFKFSNSVTLQQKGVTIKGAGIDKSVLDFSGQTAGSDGLLVLDGSDGVTFADFTIKDTKGNATKVTGSTGVHWQRVKVQWTAADGHTHGPYGLYPVGCKNVLIENSIVIGAADSGIYVGQSSNIIVRNNQVSQSVAGIEIENSFQADVMGNNATDNTAGILVFDLPNLQQQGGHQVRVFNNTMTGNNRTNFAAAGDIVAIVPAGIGFFVMANHDVEVFGNTITNNNTGATGVISYALTGQDLSKLPASYYPYPTKINIHDNVMTGNGTAPDPQTQLGTLFLFNKSAFSGGVIAAELYDGIIDPNVANAAGANPMQICYQNNGSAATFANLHFDQFDQSNPTSLGVHMTQDATAYTCAQTALPAVTLP